MTQCACDELVGGQAGVSPVCLTHLWLFGDLSEAETATLTAAAWRKPLEKGQYVFTGGGDEAAIARGVYDTYTTSNLRYSQMAPLDTYEEVNTGNNLPAQIDIAAVDGINSFVIGRMGQKAAPSPASKPRAYGNAGDTGQPRSRQGPPEDERRIKAPAPQGQAGPDHAGHTTGLAGLIINDQFIHVRAQLKNIFHPRQGQRRNAHAGIRCF